MFQDEESKVEQPAIVQLIKQGWTYVLGGPVLHQLLMCRRWRI